MSAEIVPAGPRAAGGTAVARALAFLRGLPWWALVLIVYAAARFFSFLVFSGVARFQAASPWGPVHPDYLTYMSIWDGDWYRTIFDSGYPSALPLKDDGSVAQNAWAFYPLYPALVRLLSGATGLGWLALAPAVSLVAGAGACLLAYRLFRLRAGRGTALTGAALFAMFPTSAVLQTTYAESLSLLLLAAALLLVIRRHYLWAIPVVAAMALSRPVGVPFAFFMAAHLIWRILRRREEPYPPGQVAASWALGLATCAAALAWPAIAWAVTGSPSAYTDTEASWTGGRIHWFSGWFVRSLWVIGPFWGPVAVVAVVGAMTWLILSRAGRTMGADLQAWCLAYGFYLFMVFSPQTSTFRMLLPLFPLALVFARPRSWPYRVAVLVGFGLLQLVWVAWLWHFSPPSDYPP